MENGKNIDTGSRIIITEGIYKGKKGFVYSIFDKNYTIEFEYKSFRKQFTLSYLRKIE